MTTPADLPATWRDRADELEPYAAPAAEAFRRAAAELDAALRARAAEELTLGEAAEASGYSKRRLRELVADGTIPQAGRKGAPRIRRADLPVKPGQSPRHETVGYDADADADALAGAIG